MRPSKLDETVIERAREYVDAGWSEIGHALPHAAGLATYLGVSRKTLYNWREGNEEFLHILDRLLGIQETELWNKGLKGEYQPTLVKLMLTKHGYSDRQEISGIEGAPVEVDTEHKVVIEVVEPDGG